MNKKHTNYIYHVPKAMLQTWCPIARELCAHKDDGTNWLTVCGKGFFSMHMARATNKCIITSFHILFKCTTNAAIS